VIALFDAKYGTGHEQHVILRLVPRAAGGAALAH
jgi:hypothetical protein